MYLIKITIKTHSEDNFSKGKYIYNRFHVIKAFPFIGFADLIEFSEKRLRKH